MNDKCPSCETPNPDVADAWEDNGEEHQTLVCTKCYFEWEIIVED